MNRSDYRGRFAPSPTGSLHFGSLVAALGSYLDAKHHRGAWLVRIEDLDTPRCAPGAANDILHTLEAFGLHWDEEIICQSLRTAAYDEAMQRLRAIDAVYPCCCTRREIADSALHGVQVYPGTCRNGLPAGREGHAWRVRTDLLQENICFDDILQGRFTQNLARDSGDFVVKRADGLYAYQLAVVVDDKFQGITHVVRGSDLLACTPRQLYLQHLLGFDTPAYLHLPVAVNKLGEKLSKQTLARPVEKNNFTLFDALTFLRQHPPYELRQSRIEKILAWAIANWRPDSLLNCRQSAI